MQHPVTLEQIRPALMLERWQSLDRPAQRSAVCQLLQALDYSFEPVSLEPFGDVPIATLRHRESQVLFHLIPGGQFLMGFDEPQAAALEQALSTLHPRRSLPYPSVRSPERWVSPLELLEPELDEHECVQRFLTNAASMRPVHSVLVPPFLLARSPLTEAELGALLAESQEISDELDEDDDEELLFDADLVDLAPSTEAPLTPSAVDELLEKQSHLPPADTEAVGYVSPQRCAQVEKTLHRLGLRLPSEAEWEYACRAAQYTLFVSGNQIPRSPEVPVNRFGLSHMGSEPELCADSWHPSYQGAPSDARPWVDGSPDRVVRGGAALAYPWQACGEWLQMLCAARSCTAPHQSFAALRPARSL